MSLTHSRLLEVLDYNRDTGVFTWLKKASEHRGSGDVAGYINDRGYSIIKIAGTTYRAHRLAIYYINGKWPVSSVDHINGNTEDNRLVNLRCCTSAQNRWNSKKPTTNTSGYKGISELSSGAYGASAVIEGTTYSTRVNTILEGKIFLDVIREFFQGEYLNHG